MLFTQIEFFIFFIVLLALLLVARENRVRKIILLVGSCYFYAYWDWRFLGLLAVSTFSDYQIGKLLARSSDTGKRRLLLGTSLLVNLGILGTFKYCNFFLSSLTHLFAGAGLHVGTLSIILPLGISFYTFRTLSYTIDVYRGKMEACHSLLDYAVFVTFFPTMVAGPIVRASELLPQLARPVTLSAAGTLSGFRSFITGLFLKVFIADRMAGFTNYVFGNVPIFDSLTVWLAAVGYSVQLYLDFAGYSMMAIGLSEMMGYEVPENFNFPYISRNIADFWRRWHITLSNWIRDYVYISLGGNRKGAGRSYLNLLIAMSLCGLWHGAAWTFVFWGFYHGVALAVHRMWTNRSGGQVRKEVTPGVISLLSGRFLTLLVVVVGWVFFRADGFGTALAVLGKMFAPSSGVAWYHPFLIGVLVCFALVQLAELFGWGEYHRLPVNTWYTPAIIFTMIWLCLTFPPTEFAPFIYSQF